MLEEDLSTAKLSDYGVARVQVTELDSTTHMHDGTPAYLCPLVGHLGLRTTASDIYSIGVVLLQMLLGEPDVGVAK